MQYSIIHFICIIYTCVCFCFLGLLGSVALGITYYNISTYFGKLILTYIHTHTDLCSKIIFFFLEIGSNPRPFFFKRIIKSLT